MCRLDHLVCDRILVVQSPPSSAITFPFVLIDLDGTLCSDENKPLPLLL